MLVLFRFTFYLNFRLEIIDFFEQGNKGSLPFEKETLKCVRVCIFEKELASLLSSPC